MNAHSLLDFPCQFPIKIMGSNHPDFENDMVMIVRQHISPQRESMVRSKPSRTGKYLAVTITFTAASKAQLDTLYAALHTHPNVKMML